MFDKLVTQILGQENVKAIKDGVAFAAKKANEAAEGSKEHTRLLSDILEELKTLNGKKPSKK